MAFVAPAATAGASSAGGASSNGSPGRINDARFGTAGSATPTYGSRTVPHWSFTYTDPTNHQFTRNGTTPLGLNSWDGRYTFMGSRTTGISSVYNDGFGTVAQGCG
jgi:hypothetical protein